ncbi:hypothetical protein R0137_01310 [Congregibacter brevis]|uniref:PepSY-associated TM region n=1 Tax=Congregibacter brevis TaxID=3081201 RepID=A0ABZ0ICF6_9GAMM|nr:hypothetical protein R0137_01310 [Congregibacter sp. IMCC45268]
MSRSLFISIHLYLSSFFAAVVVLVAFSGGMYLLGVKGSLETTPVGQTDGGVALMSDPSKEAVLTALSATGIEDFSFDYVITRGDTLYTRPTSRTYYGLTIDGDSVSVSRNEPSFQKRMQELHFGHGPSMYREFQKVFAAGMLFIILSGVWLGLSSSRLRVRTLIAAGSGLIVFLGLVMS